MADPSLAKVARSTDATTASTKFDVDLGVARWIRVFALAKHTISRLGSIRIRGSNVSADFSSPVYDSGTVNVWPVIYPQYSLRWGGSSSLDGRLAAEDAAGYNIHFTHVPADPYYARYWRFEITDTTNAAGFIDIARLFMAPGWQPTVNQQLGASLGWTTRTTSQESDGGATYYNVRPRRRQAHFTIPLIETDEAMANAFEMQRQLGLAGQVYYIQDPDDTSHLFRRAFPATLRELSPIEQPFYGRHTTPFSLDEVL